MYDTVFQAGWHSKPCMMPKPGLTSYRSSAMRPLEALGARRANPPVIWREVVMRTLHTAEDAKNSLAAAAST